MKIGAGAAGSGNHVIIEPSPSPEQAGDRDAVRRCPVLFNARSRVGVTAGAVVQV